MIILNACFNDISGTKVFLDSFQHLLKCVLQYVFDFNHFLIFFKKVVTKLQLVLNLHGSHCLELFFTQDTNIKFVFSSGVHWTIHPTNLLEGYG